VLVDHPQELPPANELTSNGRLSFSLQIEAATEGALSASLQDCRGELGVESFELPGVLKVLECGRFLFHFEDPHESSLGGLRGPGYFASDCCLPGPEPGWLRELRQ